MKKLIAIFGILALAACGGDADETARHRGYTTTVAPAAETTPVVTPRAATTMAAPTMTTDTNRRG